MLLVKIKLHEIPMTRENLQTAPSPRQLLNEQGVLRISGFQSCHDLRFGTLNVGSLCGRKTEVCEELRRRRVDVCCLQEVRWKGQGARFLGSEGRRFKLWWSGNEMGSGGVGILVKEEISGSVVEVRRRSDRVMSIVLIIGKELIRVLCAYGPQSGRPEPEKDCFYDEMESEWDLGNSSEITFALGDFNGHVGRYVEGFEGVHGGNGIGKINGEGRRLLEFCMEKELCVANTWFKKNEKNKITYSGGEHQTEIDFVLVGKQNRKYIKDVKVIPWELQHRLVVLDLNKKFSKKIVKKEQVTRRRVWKLTEKPTRAAFQKRVQDLVSGQEPNVWKSFREGVLHACDEVCGKKTSRRDRGDKWWWNEEVKNAISRKKTAFKEMCRLSTDKTKAEYKRIRNQTKKVIAAAMRKEAEEELNNLNRNPNCVFSFLKRMKKEGKDLEGGRCLRGRNGQLGFFEKDRAKIWKEHMEKIMNEENEWDQMVEINAVEGPIERITREEVVEAMRRMKSGKATGPSEVSVEMIIASGEIGIKVMMNLCQCVLDGKGMPNEWKSSVIVPIFKGKGDAMSCGSYRGIKLLEHAMKIVERVLEKRVRALINLNEMQFGFMPGKGTMDAIFIVRRMQEEYQKKEKNLYMCFVDMEKAFDRVPRKVMEWAMRKKGLLEVMVQAIMSLYDGAKTRVKVGSAYSEEFEVKVGVHQGSVLSPLLFAIVVDVVTENARRDGLYEILYADDLVLMSETMKDLELRFRSYKEAFESKGLKVNIRKTKTMVSGTEGEVFKSKIDPCGICGRRVMANSVLCTKCKNWIHGRCAKTKKVTTGLAMRFVCSKCHGEMDGKLDSIEKLCEEVEMVNGFCYLGDRLNASGGCEAAVTTRVRIGWKRFRECGELLLGNRFPLKMKGKVYRCCVRSAVLYGSETWCLRENEKAILRRAERAMLRAMCGRKFADKLTTAERMDMLGLKETMDGLAIANAVRWYGHVLRRDDDDVLKIALNFEVNGKRKRGRPRKTWKQLVEKEINKIGLKTEDALDRAKWRDGVRTIAEGVG